MSVSTALVTQYYQGILRLTPTTAEVNQLAALPDLSSVTSSLLSTADTTVDPILRLYQAAFGRVPDTQGLTNMVSVYSGNAHGSGTLSLAQLAGQFTGSPEFLNLYGAQTTNHASNVAFVSALYVNVLQRSMVGSEGDGWIALLDAGGSRTTTLTGFSESPEFKTATSTAINNFLSSAGALTNSYTGNLFYYGPASDANTHALGYGTDVINGSAGYNVFDAGLVNNGAGTLVNSLNNSDRLTGGSGVNTIDIDLVASGTAVTPTVLNSIQNVNLQNEGNATLDLTNSNAVTNINVHDNAGTQTVQGIQSATTNFSVTNSAHGVTFNVAAAALTGTADVANLTVKGVQDGGTITFGAGYETLKINSVNYSANNTTNVIETDFSGKIVLQDLGQANGGAVSNTLSGTASSTSAIASTNVDASGLTGTLVTALSNSNTTIVGGSGNTTITGGAGANTVTYGNGSNVFNIDTLAHLATDTIKGGTATDALTFTANVTDATTGGTATEVALANITNFNTLNLSSTGTNDITVGTNFRAAGFNTINGGSSADIVIMTGAFSGTTVNGGAAADTVTFNNTASGTVTVANVETVSVGAAQASGNVTLSVAGTTTDMNITLATGNADSVTVADNYSGTLSVASVDTVNIGSAHNGNTVLLNGGVGNTVVNVTGAGTGAVTVNALYGNAAGTNADSFFFGAGNDTLNVYSLATVSNDTTVVGGAGTDTLSVASSQPAGVDASFAKIKGFEVLTLANTSTGGYTNDITIGTNFQNAGFNTINMGASGDTVIVTGTSINGTTINGGAGSDLVQFNNTASATVTVANVETVSVGAAQASGNITLSVGASTGNVSITLATGNADSVTVADNYSGTLSVASVDTVNIGSAHNGNTVLLNGGVGNTVVNVTGAGTGAVTVNALYGNAAGTNADSFFFGAGNDTLNVYSLATVSNDTTVVGGAGTDTLSVASSQPAGVDASFAKIKGFEVLTLANTSTGGYTNDITIGTNFQNAGFNTINMGASGDTVIVSGVSLSGTTINGGAGTDSVQFTNTGGGTISIAGVESVTSTLGSVNDSVTLLNGSSAASVGISLGAGTDTVTNLNTAGATVNLTSVESYIGSMGADTITLGSTGATTINGGGGVDVLNLGVNIANASVTEGGNTGSLSINGNAAAGDVLAIIGAGTYITTGVETVNVSSSVAASIAAKVNLTAVGASGITAGDNVLYTYTLGANDTASFTLANVTAATTGGSALLTVNAAAGDTITINNSALLAGQTGDILIATSGSGYNSITLGGTSSDVIQTNLANVPAGAATGNSFVVSNFGAAGGDIVDLSGGTLKSALGVSTVLKTAYLDAAGIENLDTFTLNTTFVTGNSTTLANLTSAPNQQGVIFEFGMGSTTADFTTAAGISTAVSYITGNIGTTTTGSQAAVMAVSDGNSHQALFMFTDNGTSGITSSELKLIGVVSGSVLGASNFG
jgi:Domain of unknown function (DUF4214)